MLRIKWFIFGTNLLRSSLLWLPLLFSSSIISIVIGHTSALAEVEYILENYNYLLTYQDCGFDQFGGNTGGAGAFAVCDKQAIPPIPRHRFVSDSADGPSRSLNLKTDSLPNGEYFGIFHSLAGLDTFPSFSINLDDFFGRHSGEPVVTLDTLRFRTKHNRPGDGHYRVKKDSDDPHDTAIAYRDVQPVSGWQIHEISLTDFPLRIGTVDRSRLKQLVFVIERSPTVENPTHIDFLLDHIAFVDLGAAPDNFPGMSDNTFLRLVARRTLTYFLDNVSRDSRSMGIPQDRSTFSDLLTVGGLGFSLSALCIANHEGWMSHAEAARQVHQTLSILDNSPQSPGRIGTIGYRGFFYHFLDTAGKRKLNEDKPLKTVELSTIDTALTLMEVIAVKNHFTGNSVQEQQIRSFAQYILSRVDWPFMLRSETVPANRQNQFYLGWKPNEPRFAEPPSRFRMLTISAIIPENGETLKPWTSTRIRRF